MARLMIHLTNDEQREFHEAAERERRDLRDQIVLLALRALRDESNKQHLSAKAATGEGREHAE